MKRFETFQWARRFRLLNLVLQVVLVLSLFAGFNYLARAFSWRFDLTRNRFYSLSAETRSYLERLQTPVTAVVTFPRESPEEKYRRAYDDVRALLQEYAYVTEKNTEGRVSIEFVDVYRERGRAEALGLDQPYVVLFSAGDRRKALSYEDLYGQGNSHARTFVGERAFTGAILDVSDPRRDKIYFLTGHGETNLESVEPNGISQLRDSLVERNYEVAPLNLFEAEKVPSDASLLVIVSPKTPFQPQEEELLRRYLSDRAGRVVALLDSARPHGLDRLLDDWGIVAEDVKVIEVNLNHVTESGNLYVTNFTPHPITEYLVDNKLAITFGATPRAIRSEALQSRDTGLLVTQLAHTSREAWGERGYAVGAGSVLHYNPNIDLPGPVSLAAASERASAENLPFSVRGGRLVVFGSSEFVTNDRLTSLGNFAVFINAAKWTLGQDVPLNIPPRSIERFQLSLSQEQMARLYWILLLALPGAAALLGLVVYWSRRY